MSDVGTWSTLASGALGAVFGGWVTLAVAGGKVRADNVTVERGKWREKVRTLALQIAQGGEASRHIWFQLALNLNPSDLEDIALVALARDLGGRTVTPDQQRELSDRFALLLKHDWERAKGELHVITRSTKRLSFSDYRASLTSRDSKP